MARTAPDVTGSPTVRTLTLRVRDNEGDKGAFSVPLRSDASDADIEQAIADYSDGTSCDVYEVWIKEEFSARASANAAVNASRDSVLDVMNITYQANDRLASPQTVEVRGPVPGMFVAGTDNVNTASAIYGAIRDSFEAIMPAQYEPSTVRFTERKDYNSAVFPA